MKRLLPLHSPRMLPQQRQTLPREIQPAGTVSLKEDHPAGTDSPQENQADDGLKWRLKLRAELATTTFIRLIRNPSVVSAFAGLYPGPDADEELDEDTNLPEVDE